MLPPNVHSVPSLLLVAQKYSVITGEPIYQYFEKQIGSQHAKATEEFGEPVGYVLNSNGGMNIMSESYTDYSLSPEELSAKGKGRGRKTYDYVSAAHDNMFITTPEDNYRSNKLRADDVSLDDLQRRREMDIGGSVAQPNIAQLGNTSTGQFAVSGL
jgi:hypothetical protein